MKSLKLTGRILAVITAGAILMVSSCTKEMDSPDTAVRIQDEDVVAVAVQNGRQHVANEIIVKFREGTPERARQAALGRVNGTVKEKIHTPAMRHSGDNEGITLIRTPMAAMDALSRVKGLTGVEYAEPNWIYTIEVASNDTYYLNGSLWGMYGDETTPSNQFGSQAGEAWARNRTGSENVYVGIIDEGYMYTHVELAPNAGRNPGETEGDGIDNDGNGYIDDVYGWDFNGDDNTVFDGMVDDHGTHVAGTIGAVGGNGIGVAGVCWQVKILNAKFLGRKGGTTANAIKAVDYFTDLKTRQKLNIVATNNSWSGGGFSKGLQDAIERANEADILFIASAGNNGIDTEIATSYPSGYPNSNIIAVASITSTGALSSFSNYAASKVDLGAPGSSILSTVPLLYRGKIVSGLAYYSGTSMSTPHVTGAAALYSSTHRGANAAAIKKAILGSAVPTPSLAGKCLTDGRLDVSGF